MISIVTSQAIALGKTKPSQARPAPLEGAAPAEATAAARPGLLRRVLDALIPPRPWRTGKSGRIED
jgi:hypothetical protein